MREPNLDLLEIVARAASLEERLVHRRQLAVEVPLSAAGAARFERWAASLSQHDPHGFRHRLEWAGWNDRDVRAAMESPLAPSGPWPGWAGTLEAVVAVARELARRGPIERHPDRPTFPLDPADPVPFEEVLLPFVLAARSMLRRRLESTGPSTDGSPWRLFSQSAWRQLERGLLLNVLGVAGRALDAEFCAFRPAGYSLLTLLVGETAPAGDGAYRRFTGRLLESGLLDLFRAYPVLARLLATTVDTWVDATAELYRRLHSDLPEIVRVLAHHAPGAVVGIQTGLSDPHRGSRTVATLTFESGVRVIYKPRNIGMEVGFNRLLDWCNQYDDGPPFRTLRAIARPHHGWMEHVQHEPCDDEAGARRFYHRAGRLLCLVHVLRGTDCHWENLIAGGEHPVLVDLEALLQHEPPPMDDEEADRPGGAWVADAFHDSVVRTGLLPRWQIDEHNGTAYDISGLGAVDLQLSPRRVLRWMSINRDDMRLRTVEASLPRKENAVVLQGRVVSPHDHVEEIVAGFGDMYRFLLARREALLAPGGPIASLASERCRFLPRHTEVYSAVLHQAGAPDSLRDGVDRSIVLDALSRGLIGLGRKPRAWTVLAWELRALEALDIPYVEAVPDSRSLRLTAGETADEYFDEASYPQAVAVLRSLDPADLAHQVAIIEGVFSARASSVSFAERLAGAAAPAAWAPSTSQGPVLGREGLMTAAQAVATEIAAHARRARDGSVYWLSLGQAPHSERYQLQPLGPGLFDGYVGVALFLAALDATAGTERHRDLIVDCVRPLCDALRHAPPTSAAAFARRIGIGGGTGLGSVVYALTRTARFLDAPDFLESADRAAAWISRGLIAADRDLDVVGGSAGAILGLLCLYAETGTASHLTTAVECGHHLLQRRQPARSGARAWRTRWTRPLTGFSHGAAGIAYALLRLHAATGDAIWLAAAREGIGYERSTFSAAAGNWPDFRGEAEGPGELRFMMSWCHGAPGIALARLGGLPALDEPEVRDEIEVALRTSRRVGVAGVDHVCCGNFGRIELLQVAAQRLRRPELAEEAMRHTEAVVARAEQHGSYRLLPELPYDVFCPGFFHGTSGIGYQLLRQAFPELLPSVLLWE